MNWSNLNTVIILLFLFFSTASSAQAYENLSRNKDIVLEKVESLRFESWQNENGNGQLAMLEKDWKAPNAKSTMATAPSTTSADSDSPGGENQEMATSPSDSLETKETDYSRSSSLTLKPRVGLGFGTFTFFGDVGSKEQGYSIANSNLAYHISVTNEFNPYFDIRLYAIFGQLSMNESSTNRKLNFNSEMRIGGAAVSYNFSHFLPERNFLEPFVSVGIETFEYNSKTDLKDANGNYYHYWSDGTIRDLPEGSPNAGDAQLLQRDYHYETDLREMDLDGMGKYQMRSWSVPVGLGVNLNVTDRFEVRLSSTYHFTFTDMIDNVSSEGEGSRKGNSRNDQFFYNSVALNYDLNITPDKKSTPKSFEELGTKDGLLAEVDMDGDSDGVHDFEDECLGTPPGVEVDSRGCPVDSDKDGVADYLDMEAATAKNAPVNSDGVTVTDEEFYQQYLFWMDSLSVKENFARIHSDKTDLPQHYALRIGSQEEGLSQDEINKILGFDDVKSINFDGELIYLVGDYKDLADAVNRKITLQNQGLTAEVMRGTAEGVSEISEETKRAESDLVANIGASQILDQMEDLSLDDTSSKVIYRVQVGAYKDGFSGEVFENVPELVAIKGKDDLVRYSSGAFSSSKEAAKRKVELLLDGFDGAFIAAYQNGERVTLASTGVKLSEGAEDEVIDQETNGVNPESVFFRVQLGAYEQDIPTKVLEKFFKLGNVKPMNFGDGIIRYMTSQLDTYEEATKVLNEAIKQGIDDAFIVGDFMGKFISVDEARRLSSGSSETVDNINN